MPFELRHLGWKAFQDLCAAVVAEVLGRPVQTFLPARDGGRDGAFVGTWDGAPRGAEGKSTIQCKFTSKADARLTLAQLSTELVKVSALAARGLASDYVVMTNAGVTGEAEAAICAAFQEAGVGTCRVFGGDWIMGQILERPRLRMMAPRLYGLVGLGELITGPAYDQARAILGSMGHDLASFVPTSSQRAAVEAIHSHGFVLLLGDPATGKSTIAATLALGALDDGCTGAVKISSPDQLHLWRPSERQFLWVDDAFGATQYEPARVQRWNAELPTLRAAVREGTKVVLTSRSYIWLRARQQLKTGAFPQLSSSQIVIDVHALSPAERARILYNHLRNGGQASEFRRALKPFLAGLASNPAMTPEIARRLGDPVLARGLRPDQAGLADFVERPVEFLREVILNLSDPGRAALALVFMHPSAGVPSPIPQGRALQTVSRLTGAPRAEIGRELEAMSGSLTLLSPGPEGDRWTFRHPTIGDAFADVVAESPEQIELYVAGADLDRLLVEVVCMARKPKGAKVRVPASLYPVLIGRLERRPLDYAMIAFLASRCDPGFLRAFVAARPDTLELSPWLQPPIGVSPGYELLPALLRAGCLPEPVRLDAACRIDEAAMDWMDPAVFVNADVRALLTNDEYDDLERRFRVEWIDDVEAAFGRWQKHYSSSDELASHNDFKDNLQKLQKRFATSATEAAFDGVLAQLDELIRQLEDDEPEQPRKVRAPEWIGFSVDPDADIFDDVDD